MSLAAARPRTAGSLALIRPMMPSTSSVSTRRGTRLRAWHSTISHCMVHLAQPALGVVLRAGHDRDVVDPLAVPGLDVEAEANHGTFSRSLAPFRRPAAPRRVPGHRTGDGSRRSSRTGCCKSRTAKDFSRDDQKQTSRRTSGATGQPAAGIRAATALLEALVRVGESGRSHSSAADAARRRRVVGHLSRGTARPASFASSARCPSSRWRRTGARRSSAIAGRSTGCASPARIVPGAVPAILGEDRAAGAFAMAWLPPERLPGVEGAARRTARRPARRPRGSATCSAASTRPPPTGRTSPRASRPTRSSTRIRLEPYLETTARAHPDLADGADWRSSRRPRATQAGAGPRRLQPEEPADRARRDP